MRLKLLLSSSQVEISASLSSPSKCLQLLRKLQFAISHSIWIFPYFRYSFPYPCSLHYARTDIHFWVSDSLQVENELFKIPTNYLKQYSAIFNDMFALNPLPGAGVEGQS